MAQLGKTIGMVNVTRPGLQGYVPPEQLKAAIPALNRHSRMVGQYHASYRVVLANSFQECLDKGWIPHFVANVAADTPVARVEGAGGFHWGLYTPNAGAFYGEPFGVSYSSYDDGQTGVAWERLTIVITHENAEIAGNPNVTDWTEVYLPTGAKVYRWGETADPVQSWAQSFLVGPKGIAAANATVSDTIIRTSDFVIDSYTKTFDYNDREIRTFCRMARSSRYVNTTNLSVERVLKVPPNFIFQGGYMAQVYANDYGYEYTYASTDAKAPSGIEYVLSALDVPANNRDETIIYLDGTPATAEALNDCHVDPEDELTQVLRSQITVPYSPELMTMAPKKQRMPGSRIIQCLDKSGYDCEPWMIRPPSLQM